MNNEICIFKGEGMNEGECVSEILSEKILHMTCKNLILSFGNESKSQYPFSVLQTYIYKETGIRKWWKLPFVVYGCKRRKNINNNI